MKAVLCRSWDGPAGLRYEDVAPQRMAAGCVRITVRAAGVNFADSLMVSGKYQVKHPFPFCPGLEVAGEVGEVAPDVTDLRPGQRVMAFLGEGGGMRQDLVVPAAAAVSIPDAMDFPTAAAFPATYGTAWYALNARARLAAGEFLLVTGAAGGVGLAAVEVGKLLGARVIAAAGGAAKCAIAREHGADHVIDYNSESIRDRVRAITGGAGADVVFDPVGAEAFEQAIRAVAWQARMLVIGFAAGRIQQVPANLILVKNISIIGVVWGAQQERDPLFAKARLQEVAAHYDNGTLRPLIGATYPMAAAGTAMEALLSRKIPGKIVLIP
jgi:NADPH2:quinone reductase